jgi:tetratricopeptide (TPR) repeat protein
VAVEVERETGGRGQGISLEMDYSKWDNIDNDSDGSDEDDIGESCSAKAEVIKREAHVIFMDAEGDFTAQHPRAEAKFQKALRIYQEALNMLNEYDCRLAERLAPGDVQKKKKNKHLVRLAQKKVKSEKVSCLLNMAVANIRIQRWTKAVKICTLVLDMEPDNAKAYEMRGFAYKSLGDMDSCKSDFCSAVERSKGCKEAQEELSELRFKETEAELMTLFKNGQSLSRQQQYREAAESFETLLDKMLTQSRRTEQHEKLRFHAHYWAGVVYSALANTQKSIEHLEEGLGLRQNGKVAYWESNAQTVPIVVDSLDRLMKAYQSKFNLSKELTLNIVQDHVRKMRRGLDCAKCVGNLNGKSVKKSGSKSGQVSDSDVIEAGTDGAFEIPPEKIQERDTVNTKLGLIRARIASKLMMAGNSVALSRVCDSEILDEAETWMKDSIAVWKTALESESITLSPDDKRSYRVQNAICWDILGDLRLLCEEDNNNTKEEDALVFKERAVHELEQSKGWK